MPSRHAAHPAPSNCSAFSARLGEPLAGTAPVATAWLAVEQPGPWGARALTQSHLDAELGAELNRRAEGTGVRIALIRRVGHHALTSSDAKRRVLICTTQPGAAAVRALTVADPRELLDLDLAALGNGRIDAGAPHPDPVILVCTNGKRDRCCAELGRALALDLEDAAASRQSTAANAGTDAVTVSGTATGFELWEADHLGGHRFAPTAVLLPSGYSYGRLDAAAALTALDDAARGQVAIENARGRSTWSRPGQAADLALRAELQEFDADAVRVLGEQRLSDDRWTVDLAVGNPVVDAARLNGRPDTHAAGRDGDPGADPRGRYSAPGADSPGRDGEPVRYRALVEQSAAAEPRPESCGKPFGNPTELRVIALDKQP